MIVWRCRCVDDGHGPGSSPAQPGNRRTRTEGEGERENSGENSQQIPRMINHSRLGCVVVIEGCIDFAQCSNNELLLISTSFLKDRS